MKKTRLILSGFLAVILMVSCKSTGTVKVIDDLGPYEKHVCDSLQLDPSIIKNIRVYNDSLIKPFPNSMANILEMDVVENAGIMHLNGLIFTEQNAKSYDIVFTLKDSLRKKGYYIFLLKNNFNIYNRPDYVGVLKTTDQYEVLKRVGTDGINYNIDNDSLINLMRGFDKKYSLELIGASGDWCEFRIKKEPVSWKELSNEIYKICPDVVDQGTGTIESLEEELKKGRRIYLWWD